MTAIVTGGHLAALRAFLTGDGTSFDRIIAVLDDDGSWYAYGVWLEAAFAVAARRRFPDGYKADEVIRFVGKTRAACHDKTGQIDPGMAERLFRKVLSGPASAVGLGQDAMALAMMTMLKALVTEENLSDPELDAFLAESLHVARRAGAIR
jgi:hypothetical protein